ncbi:carbon-nitrogen hydrolase family protein [Sphingomonas sp. R647]|uniref:carbon-nitrogen hydrolase family protein n=1 Tax=Sphingomonas sp. R647 TaxID=2875233 RepID=UPI001CD7A8B6|nr:carbon-nitrogen hydrolase family protein [Sphingomonas sp. R647]MCA1199909.1 carbon-nitrogen hydrolase family protein [Sphingomonas sp. R647]
MTAFTLATSAYPVEQLIAWDDYAAKIARWVAEAADGGAKLAVFPEYAGMELTAQDAASVADLHGSIAAMGALVERVDALHVELSVRHGIHICAGSLPVREADGVFRNHARLFAPSGKSGTQRKIVMTRFEREIWNIGAGSPLHVFDTDLGRIGIAICYDVEFPLLVRAQVEAGATLILAPSATDTLHGYHRVRVGAQARALENQCYVVQSSVVGDAEWTPSLGTSHGAAGIYGPPDLGFPADGVVARGAVDAPGWVFGEIDPEKVARVRRKGSVFNYRHWDEQGATVTLPVVEVVDLR